MKRPWYARPAEAVLRRLGRLPPPDPVPTFELRAPAVQNALDLFAGRWACDLSDPLPGTVAGTHRMFTDGRPQHAADILGRDGRLEGYRVLELGPLEGVHSIMLERLGAAEVVAVEANATAFLKCLVVKEALHAPSRIRFMLGDFSGYLRGDPGRFDLIFACGVLYHMTDPLELIALVAAATDRCFVWTQYFDPVRGEGRRPSPGARDGFPATYWRQAYDPKGNQFWGGVQDQASWMERDAILEAFRHFGLKDITVIEDSPDHPNGPAFTFTARRQ